MSQAVGTTNTVELEIKDELQTVNKEIASIDIKNTMDEKSQKVNGVLK